MAVKKGYKQTEVGVIPEDWDVTCLGSIAAVTAGGTPSRGVAEFWNGGIPWVTTSEVDFGRIKKTAQFISASGLRHSAAKMLSPGTILLALYGQGKTRGKVAILDIDAASNQACAAIVLSGIISRDFVFRYLVSRYEFIRGLSNTGNQENLNGVIIRAIPVPLPPTLAEQEAIAGALSDADAWIESLEQLIAKKRLVKQGAMQELLTGKRRLPGFSGEWETKQVGRMANVGRGRVISHREISKSVDPMYPVFSSQTLNNGVMGYIDTYDFEGEYVTWTTDGANAGTVFARAGRFNCTNVCGTILLMKEDYRFIALALGRIAKHHVSKHLGNPKLMNDVMKRIEICVPSSIAEQTAIATVLSDMDAEIESLEVQLAKAREIKQGMMQELLTGRIRLVI